MKETLADIGEIELINRLKKYMPENQINDDTAHIKSNSKDLLINTDVMVDEVHFSKTTTSPEDVGWRATTANLSDLIASGVEEIIGITVGLVAPPTTPWEWVEGVYSGIKKVLDNFGGTLLGGDCSTGQQKLLAITALGTVGPLRIHRAHAVPGDWLVASGPHGLSRLGLGLLLSDPLIKVHKLNLPNSLQTQAILAHQRPLPPIAALKALQKCKPKELPWRAGGTDSSDGLLTAINNLCISSNCQAVLNPKKLPKIKDWPSGSFWDDWCINGGEDFELILSIPPAWAKAIRATLPNSQIIGFIKKGKPSIMFSNGTKINIDNTTFNHF